VAEAVFQNAGTRTGGCAPGPAWLNLPRREVYNFSSQFLGDFMSEQLADKKCVPCRGGVPPLKGKELEKLHQSVPKWMVYDEHHLHREFKFPDFKQALEFVNRVGALAEEQGHHPDILLAWGKAEITLWTHKIDGLTESDFIMAAKIDRLSAAKPIG
jgi:4a-hydroxytetrahydrobiopterin dehydratase